MIRKACKADIPAIAAIYDRLHDAEEAGKAEIGWVRGVYPTKRTAQAALERGDLFVMEEGGKVVGAAILNQTQVPEYYGALWEFPARDEEVMVLHTLTIDPNTGGKGYGKAFVAFYEQYARETAAVSCGWTPTGATPGHGKCTLALAIGKSASCPAISTAFPESIWFCWKNHCSAQKEKIGKIVK